MKKAVSYFLTVCLFCSLLTITPSADTTMPFIKNDDIVYLPSNEQPIIIDDEVFFPVQTVLAVVGGNYKYDEVTDTLTVYKGTVSISFYRENNIAVTYDNRFYEKKVPIQNGITYIPALFVVSELGGIFSEPSPGIYRIKTRTSQISDSDIERLMHNMPSDFNNKTDNPNFYLCIIGTSQYTQTQLKILRNSNCKAVFFFTGDQIQSNASLMRQLVIEGQDIGLMLSPDFEAKQGLTSAQIADEFNRLNDILQKLTYTRSRLVMLRHGSQYNTDSVNADLVKSGYRTWKYNIEFTEARFGDVEPSTQLLMTQRNLERIKWNSVILVNNTNTATIILPGLITYMQNAGYHLRPLYETTKPVNFPLLME
ncbi:MAG: polysaccharide deacetylase family protein [Bacillota bacterium]|nr:polysaccharide deacetylase family protein [Bacillota bacterium]